MKYFPYIFFVVSAYALILSLIIVDSYEHDKFAELTASSDVYFYTRIVSILINIVLYIILSYVLYRRSSNRFGIGHKDPVRALADRMKY